MITASPLAPRRAPARAVLAAAAAILAGCAGQPDHFYALIPLPDSAPAPGARFTTQVTLTVSLPALIDRREMVIATSADEVLVLEHERWAAPLSELTMQTLARDIERRHAGVLVADRGFDQAGLVPVQMRVDIVRMSERAGQATLEARWRVVDARRNMDEIGAETWQSPAAGHDYAAVARAFSNDLGLLADRLAATLPP